MRMYTVDLTATEAQNVADTVLADGAQHHVEIWNENANLVTLALSRLALSRLEMLTKHDDGYVDDEGGLWIGGYRHELTVLDND